MALALLPFLVIGVVALPWLLIAARRLGFLVAGPMVMAGVLLAVLGVFALSALTRSDLLLTATISAIALGTAGVVVGVLTGGLPLPGRTVVAPLAAAAVGGAAWLGALALATVLPNAPALSWAMNGDAANNLRLTRAMIAANGFVPGGRNEVPLQNELLTLAFLPGRTMAQRGALLEHDLAAFGAVFAGAIGMTALLAGLVAAALLPARRLAPRVLAAGLGSLLGATWFVAGLPLDSGYINVVVALPIVLAAWLAYLRIDEHPRAVILTCLALAVVVLTSWSPLVVFPVALAAAGIVRQRARLLTVRSLLVLGVGLVLAAGWFLTLYAPLLVVALDDLRAPGHGFPFTGGILLVASAVVVVLVLRAPQSLRAGAIAMVVAAAAGLGVLVAICAPTADGWLSYYPTKFTWLATVTVGAIALSLVVRTLAERRAAVVTIGAVGVATLVLASLGPAPDRQHPVVAQPLVRLVAGPVWATGDAAVETIVRLVGADHPSVLWHSGNPDEAYINFWSLDQRGASPRDGTPIARSIIVTGYRTYRDTGAYQTGPVDTLCRIAESLDTTLGVETSDAGLERDVAEACPDQSFAVTLR